MKYRYVMCLITLLITVLCLGLLFAKPAPHEPGKVYGPSKLPVKPLPIPRYEQLLAKYLANIDQMAKEKEEATSRFEDKQREARRVADEEITKNESNVLDELRVWGKRNAGKKEPDYRPVSGKIIATSDTSARLFSTLIDENLINPRDVLSALHFDCAYLSDAWIPEILKIANNTPNDSDLYRDAVYLLYSAGVSRKEYRQVLERWCQEKTDWAALMALQALFYDVDKQTSKTVAVNSPENLSLMQKLLRENDNPEIRFVCAEYEARIGNLSHAEEICLELLARRYKGFDNVDADRGPEEDGPLYRARHFALELIFYKLHNERVFRAIYDLSRRPEDEEIKADKGEMPEGWIIYSAYSTARLELNHAKSLIHEVNDYENEH